MSSDELDPAKAFKHLRPGHVNLNRACDVFVTTATTLLPGTGTLPQRWKYVSRESFSRRFKHLGPMVWAKTASYHMLLINGHYAFRIWTDSPDTALCDVRDELAERLSPFFDILDIPKSTQKKTKPFTKRVRISRKSDVGIVLLQTMLTFDLVD